MAQQPRRQWGGWSGSLVGEEEWRDHREVGGEAAHDSLDGKEELSKRRVRNRQNKTKSREKPVAWRRNRASRERKEGWGAQEEGKADGGGSTATDTCGVKAGSCFSPPRPHICQFFRFCLCDRPKEEDCVL